MKPIILTLLFLLACAHRPSERGSGPTSDAAVWSRLDDLVGERLPATKEDNVDWDAEPIANTRSERAALALGGTRATALGELRGEVTWTLVEVWKDGIDCDLAVVACGRNHCDASRLVHLAAPSFPGPSFEAVIDRFELRRGELWVELELDFSSTWRDVDIGTDGEGEITWGEESWSGRAVFVRRFHDVISGWNALTARDDPELSPPAASWPLPINPRYAVGGEWVGEMPPKEL